MPERGQLVVIPKSEVAKHSRVEVAKAKICAKLRGIKYRIDESR